jgi:hypothetical protein
MTIAGSSAAGATEEGEEEEEEEAKEPDDASGRPSGAQAHATNARAIVAHANRGM